MRSVLWFCLGATIALLVAIPIVEHQAKWENQTLACWPVKDPQP